MTPEQEDAFRESGAPKRHRKLVLDTQFLSPDATAWLKARDRVASLCGSGFLVALVGPRGTGKTQIAVDMIRLAVLSEHKALYVRAMDLFIDLKSTYGNGARNENERTVLNRLAAPKLLVIDEVSEGADTPWEQRMLGYVIDVRYGEGQDTLLIGNFVQTRPSAEAYSQQLGLRLGDSVISRLNEAGGLIICNWKSFRG